MAHDRPQQGNPEKTFERRGLLAAAWALVAGVVAKHTTETVHAGVDGDLVLEQLNVTTAPTTTRNNLTIPQITFICQRGPDVQFPGYASGTNAALIAHNAVTNGYGAWITSYASGGAALISTAFGISSVGVDGWSSDGIAVRGGSIDGNGVLGHSRTGVGVRGEIPGASNYPATGIYGVNNSTYAGPSPGAGGFGVYGLSAKGHGLVGATAAAGGAAVVGATNGVAGAYAGTFYGPVVVSGALTVVGGPKSAAVPHPDGSHRLLYCMESPDSWFEDFGEASFDCGRADVTIDPDFAAVANLEKYHVFLTAYDQCLPLQVTKRTPAGFTVEANQAIVALQGLKPGDVSGTFSWRIVAKRKDITAERLARIEIPQAPALPGDPVRAASDAAKVANGPRHEETSHPSPETAGKGWLSVGWRRKRLLDFVDDGHARPAASSQQAERGQRRKATTARAERRRDVERGALARDAFVHDHLEPPVAPEAGLAIPELSQPELHPVPCFIVQEGHFVGRTAFQGQRSPGPWRCLGTQGLPVSGLGQGVTGSGQRQGDDHGRYCANHGESPLRAAPVRCLCLRSHR